MAPFLECRELSRYYGAVVGVDRLTMRVEAGEVLGLVGLNGAGKSTTLRLATGLLAPSAGEALLFGLPTRAALACRRRLGYLPSELPLYREHTGRENLDFLARLGRHDPDRVRRRRQEMTARLGLSDLDLDRRVDTMSHGMRQKIGLVQAMEHDPDLVLFDEPSDGLDPLARIELAALISEIRFRGGAVLLASHVLAEVERVADRVGVLHRGRLVAIEGREALRRRKALRVVASFDGPPPTLSPHPDVEIVEAGPAHLVLHARPPLDGVIKALATAKVVDLRVDEPRLEDLIRDLARRDGS